MSGKRQSTARAIGRPVNPLACGSLRKELYSKDDRRSGRASRLLRSIEACSYASENVEQAAEQSHQWARANPHARRKSPKLRSQTLWCSRGADCAARAHCPAPQTMGCEMCCRTRSAVYGGPYGTSWKARFFEGEASLKRKGKYLREYQRAVSRPQEGGVNGRRELASFC